MRNILIPSRWLTWWIWFGMQVSWGGGWPVTYATFDPTNWREGTIFLQPDNLTINGCSGGTFATVRSTIGKSSGKWYFEIFHWQSIATMDWIWLSTSTGYSWESIDSFGYYSNNGWKYNTQPWVPYWTDWQNWNNTIGVLMDMDNNQISFTWNWINQWVAYSVPEWEYFFRLSMINSWDTCVANFGASTFTYPVPSGYNSWLYS